MDINGLTHEGLRARGKHPLEVFAIVKSYMDKSEAVMAHNVSFDKEVWEREAQRYGFAVDREKIWIDTRTDLPYPENSVSRRLSHLAVDHGVSHGNAHQALFDVYTMLEIAKKYDLEKAFERAKSPLMRVSCSPPIDLNKAVKDRRYRWDPTNREWFKLVRQIDLQAEIDNLPFPLRVISGDENGKKTNK